MYDKKKRASKFSVRRNIYHLLNRFFDILHLPFWLETKEEIEEKYEKLVERLKKEHIYRED